MVEIKKFLAVRIEPKGAALYAESKPGPVGDWGYTPIAKQALAMSETDAIAFCRYQTSIGRDSRMVQVLG